ncbi:hypothetical protein [Kitasatospora sp. NBC_00315]|uniref:hypothetical protein n=1 Tax=Kitasatospora sp. NBC_00315 TaxID=2975963 RepID=UPI00324AEA81
MDAELQKIVDAVRAVEKQLRETAVGPALTARGLVPAVREEQILGAVASVLETLQGLTGIFPDRMTTPTGRTTFHRVSKDLSGLALQLRAAEGRAAADHA